MKKGKQLAALVGIVLGYLNIGVVQAEQPSYGFFEAGNYRMDLKDIGDPDGVAFNANFDVVEHVFVRASYSTTEDKFVNGFFRYEEKGLGVGYKAYFLNSSSFYVGADIVQAELTADARFGGIAKISEDDTGYAMEVGLRSAFGSWFELSTFVKNTEIFDDDDYKTYGVGAFFRFADHLGVSVGVTNDSDSDMTSFLGLRATL